MYWWISAVIQLCATMKPCEWYKQVSAKYKIATFGQNYDKVWEESMEVGTSYLWKGTRIIW